MKDAITRIEVLAEEMNGKFDLVLEYVRDIPEIKRRLIVVEEKVDRLQDDVTVLKSVTRDHSSDIAKLRLRVATS
jgi:hypothetical protein